MRLISLQRKDVVDVKSGSKIGFVSDFELDPICHCLSALIVEKSNCFSFVCLFKGPPCLVIPVEQIVSIGEDVILVNIEC